VSHCRPGETLCASRQLDAGQCVARFQLDMAFRILSCGRSDTVPHALALLGKEGVNARNDQVRKRVNIGVKVLDKVDLTLSFGKIIRKTIRLFSSGHNILII